MVMLSGPLVVSPPTKLTSYCPDNCLSESENSCNQDLSVLGSVIAKVKYLALAPIEAISLKLTAKDLCAMSFAGVLALK